jgi:predicted nucleic acid-binding protein
VIVIESLFVDTSAWFAYVNRSDAEHGKVRRQLDGYVGRIVTTDFVFDETVTLCARRLGHAVAVRIGEAMLDGTLVDLVRTSHDDATRAWGLFRERPDQRYSFTDCVSFVVMRRLRVATAVALDDDFRNEGFEVLP